MCRRMEDTSRCFWLSHFIFCGGERDEEDFNMLNSFSGRLLVKSDTYVLDERRHGLVPRTRRCRFFSKLDSVEINTFPRVATSGDERCDGT